MINNVVLRVFITITMSPFEQYNTKTLAVSIINDII